MPKPTIFIGSSSEGLPIARALEIGLHHELATVLWTTIFQLGDGTLERLAAEAPKFDYAAIVLSKDDVVTSRAVVADAPRDNVLFELGLFTAAIGKGRTFFVVNNDDHLKVPSDFAGVTVCDYFSHGNRTSQQAEISPACSKILTQVQQLGYRPRAAKYHNPNYDRDLTSLDGKWKAELIANDQTIIIVVGDTLISELLDREAAILLRDAIDSQSVGDPFRRAIVLNYSSWSASTLKNNAVIAIGGDNAANPLHRAIVEERKHGSPPKDPFPEAGGFGAFVPRSATAGPKVALWGKLAANTRSAVESWLRRDHGLKEFLPMVWRVK